MKSVRRILTLLSLEGRFFFVIVAVYACNTFCRAVGMAGRPLFRGASGKVSFWKVSTFQEGILIST